MGQISFKDALKATLITTATMGGTAYLSRYAPLRLCPKVALLAGAIGCTAQILWQKGLFERFYEPKSFVASVIGGVVTTALTLTYGLNQNRISAIAHACVATVIFWNIIDRITETKGAKLCD